MNIIYTSVSKCDDVQDQRGEFGSKLHVLKSPSFQNISYQKRAAQHKNNQVTKYSRLQFRQSRRQDEAELRQISRMQKRNGMMFQLHFSLKKKTTIRQLFMFYLTTFFETDHGIQPSPYIISLFPNFNILSIFRERAIQVTELVPNPNCKLVHVQSKF